MPDAIITSTESTFGTISGTFSADQSTISGTILGPVAGSLSGSVGVPGPAGPGVPAGGTAGQILQKIDGVDYNTDWVTASFSATWGSITGTLSDQTDLQTALDGKYSTSNPAGYITSSALSPYLTSATAASTYQTLAGMSSYLTTSAAAAGYYPLTGNPSGFLTAASLSGYATESWVTGQGYITSAALTPYLLSSTAASTYYPLSSNPAGYLTSASLSGYALLSGATFTGTLSAPTPSPGTDSTVVATTEWVKDLDYAPLNSPQFIGNPRAPTPSLSDDDTSIATTEFVKGQGYITSSALSPYLTSATAASTYQTIAGMSSYLTTSAAASTYYPLTNPSGYITSSALAGYATESWVTAGFYPLSSNPAGYLTSASLSGYATESWVTSELGSYLTTSTAASTYAPLASPALTGNPTAPTPATADNDTSIATTAFVKAQGYLTSAPVTSVAGKTGAVTLVVGDVSGAAPLASPTFTGTPAAPTASAGTSTTQLATTAFVTTADNLKANLASPTFTGTPSAPTATAGTNTTQIATTAFVTAAVPAFATFTTPSPTSTTTVVSPRVAMDYIMHPGFRNWNVRGSSSTSGAGAVVQAYSTGCTEVVGPNVSVAGFAMAIWDTGTSSFGMLGMTRGVNGLSRAWDKPVWASGRGQHGFYGDANYNGTANSVIRVSVGGKSSGSSGDISVNDPGFGWYYVPGSAMVLQVSRGNGTALTNVTSSFTPTARQIFDWKIYSDGAGNVTLYVNDSQVATTTAGPTAATAESYNFYFEMVEQTASAASRIVWESINPKIYWGV